MVNRVDHPRMMTIPLAQRACDHRTDSLRTARLGHVAYKSEGCHFPSLPVFVNHLHIANSSPSPLLLYNYLAIELLRGLSHKHLSNVEKMPPFAGCFPLAPTAKATLPRTASSTERRACMVLTATIPHSFRTLWHYR